MSCLKDDGKPFYTQGPTTPGSAVDTVEQHVLSDAEHTATMTVHD